MVRSGQVTQLWRHKKNNLRQDFSEIVSRRVKGVTFFHKSRSRPTRGTTTPPRQLPPGTPAGCPPTPQDRRRPSTDTKTSHRRPTRDDHSVPAGNCLSPIPSRYCLSTWRDSSRSYCQPPGTPQAALQRRRSDVARPPASNGGRRAGQHVTFHAFTSWPLPPAMDQFRREATRVTDSHAHPPLRTPPPRSVQHNTRYAAETSQSTTSTGHGRVTSTGHVVTSHQPANRLLPLAPNSVDRRRPLRRCQSVRVSAPGRVMTPHQPADTIPAAAPAQPERRQ